MNELKAVLSQLDKLSVDEMKELRSRLNALISLSGGGKFDPRSTGKNDSMVLQCVSTVLAGKGLGFFNVQKIRNQIDYPVFVEDVRLLMKFLDRAGIKGDKARRSILITGVDRLVRDFHDWNRPVSAKAIIENIDLVPAALDRAFPDLAAGGVLGMIVRQEEEVA